MAPDSASYPQFSFRPYLKALFTLVMFCALVVGAMIALSYVSSMMPLEKDTALPDELSQMLQILPELDSVPVDYRIVEKPRSLRENSLLQASTEQRIDFTTMSNNELRFETSLRDTTDNFVYDLSFALTQLRQYPSDPSTLWTVRKIIEGTRRILHSTEKSIQALEISLQGLLKQTQEYSASIAKEIDAAQLTTEEDKDIRLQDLWSYLWEDRETSYNRRLDETRTRKQTERDHLTALTIAFDTQMTALRGTHSPLRVWDDRLKRLDTQVHRSEKAPSRLRLWSVADSLKAVYQG